MKIVKFCAVLNILVSVVTSSCLSSQSYNEAIGDDLSELSKKVYDTLPDIELKQAYRERRKNEYERRKKENERRKNVEAKICKLESEKGYREFLCAADNIKTQSEKIYPQFVNKWEEGGNNKKMTPYKYFMCDIDSEVLRPLSFQEKQIRFKRMEKEYNVNDKFKARPKMDNFFYHMYAVLTRFDKPDYKKCLQDESYNIAQNIISKIIKPNFNDEQRQEAIIDYSVRYAHIRHCFDMYSHFYNQHGIRSTVEKEVKLQRQKFSTKTADETTPPPALHVCELLDKMGILRLWQFTEEDIEVMNVMSYSIHPPSEQMYFPSEDCIFKDKDKNGEGVVVQIPMCHERYCPVLNRQTSTTTRNTLPETTT